MKYDIFLSHCRENKLNTAIPLCQALEALGFLVWFDRGEILTGDAIYDSIKTAICHSSVIIALIAEAYLQRPWTQYELHLAISIERNLAYGANRMIFPIYQQLNHKDVESIFPELKDRAFESLNTGHFDVSASDGRTILDRIVQFYFSNHISSTPDGDREWLLKYRERKYISQLLTLFFACEKVENDLRTRLISYTNVIRYLLAVLKDIAAPSCTHRYHLIANRYCTDISDRCFLFHCDITYEMLLSCKAILSVLMNDLKAILNPI